MVVHRLSERRSPSGDAFSRALLDAPAGLSFAQLQAAAPDAEPGEVAAWIGHAIAEGLADESLPGPEGERVFRLRARGRRLLTARRRRSVA